MPSGVEHESVNQQIVDALTQRQIRVSRVETALRRDVWAQLRILEADLLGALKAGDPTDFALLARRRQAVEALMAEELAPLIETRYDRLETMTTAAMIRLALAEARAVQEIVEEETDEDLEGGLPSDASLRRAVTETRFPTPTRPTDASATGEEWWERQGAGLTQRLRDQLLVSVSLEESLTQMAARVRGTSEQGFKDGLMEKARQDASRLLTTEVTNATGEARAAVGRVNAQQLILLHTSIRDAKTSMICIARDGKRYTADTHEPIGHEIPYLSGVPYHPNCRSEINTILASGGAVAQETFATWLRRQGPTIQDELLGPTRARLFKEGKLSLSQLIDATSGRPLTLEELGA